MLTTKENFIHIFVQSTKGFFRIISIYGPTSTIGKKVVWDSIAQFFFKFPLDAFIIGGYFNVVLSSKYKIRGIIPPPKSMQDFNNFVSNSALKDHIL